MEKFFYTDYADGIVRKIRLLSYDRDKYCQVSFLNAFSEKDVVSVKSGYIFLDLGLKNRVKTSDLISTPRTPESPVPTRVQVSNERRMMRHQHDVLYSVFSETQDSDNRMRHFKSLKSAISFFQKVKTPAELLRYRKYTTQILLTKEFDLDKMIVCIQCDRKDRSVIKKHHLK